MHFNYLCRRCYTFIFFTSDPYWKVQPLNGRAPSDADRPKFFETAIDSVNNRACPNRLLIGDFNTTMSTSMDQLNYDTDPYLKCREYLTVIETGEQFHDVFRSIHPDNLLHGGRMMVINAQGLTLQWHPPASLTM